MLHHTHERCEMLVMTFESTNYICWLCTLSILYIYPYIYVLGADDKIGENGSIMPWHGSWQIRVCVIGVGHDGFRTRTYTYTTYHKVPTMLNEFAYIKHKYVCIGYLIYLRLLVRMSLQKLFWVLLLLLILSYVCEYIFNFKRMQFVWIYLTRKSFN